MTTLGLWLFPFSISGTDLNKVKEAGLYVVEITTIDNEEPQGQIISKPGDPNNQNLTYLNKVPCRIIISLEGVTLYDSGTYIKKTSGATIRVNGNTTAYFSNPLNMPYKIKLEKAADLLCRGEDNHYKDKEWRLLKDAVSLNTIIGLKISQLVGLEWTSQYVPCNVIINGDYRGCYLLMETMKRNESCRINCDQNTGYIIEKDPYWWKEDVFFCSSWYKDNNVYRWTWKYPDEEDVTDEKEKYIKEYIEAMEESLENGDYEQYIDISSFSKWILIHDILGTRDSWGSNMYIKKYDNTNNSKLELPCVWDFDSNYGVTAGSFSLLHTQTNEYFYALMNSDNRTFARKYVKLWNDNKDYITQQIILFINDFSNSEEAKKLDISRKLYNERWGYHYGTVADDIEVTLDWFNKHIYLLDKQIQLIDLGDETGIETPFRNDCNPIQYYNVNGIKMNTPYTHGLTIYRKKDGSFIKIFNNNH